MQCVPTYHLDLGESIVAVVQEISRLPAVDLDDAQQQLSAQTQGHWGLARGDDALDILLQIRGEHVLLGEFLLQVGRQPDASQRPRLG